MKNEESALRAVFIFFMVCVIFLMIHLESRGFQSEAYGFFQVEHQVHVVHGLSAGAFEEVVDAGDDEQLAAMFFQMDEALVGVHHLLQVDVFLDDVDERVAGIVFLIDAFDFLERHLGLDHECGEDAAREVAAVGDEVNFRVEAVLQLPE